MYNPWPRDIRPGDKGFNAVVTDQLIKSKIHKKNAFKIHCNRNNKNYSLQPYQRAAVYLVHPKTPIDRVLLTYATGLGKTAVMIKILDNYYQHNRSKLIIVPQETQRQNFYTELMRFNSQYRDYVMTKVNEEEKVILQTMIDTGKVKRSVVTLVADILAMKGHLRHKAEPGYLNAPLRCLTMSQAGSESKQKQAPIFKTTESKKQNIYDDMIICIDEVQNILKPGKEFANHAQRKNMKNVATEIYKAKNSVIVCATATPIIDNPKDKDEIMKIVKGQIHKNKPTNEGFVLYFHEFPLSGFPKILPKTALGGLPKIKYVTMKGENLKTYEQKTLQKPKRKRITLEKLSNYCNMATYYAQSWQPKFKNKLKTNPTGTATKLNEVVRFATKLKGKVLILCDRTRGFNTLIKLWKLNQSNQEYVESVCETKGQCWIGLEDPKRQNAEQKRKKRGVLQTFNDNDDNMNGEKLKVIIADANAYKEGVSFKGVRHVILVDIPPTWKDYQQIIGRVLRLCAYNQFQPSRRNVTIYMYIAKHPTEGTVTADQALYNRMMKGRDRLMKPMINLKNISMDRQFLQKHMPKQAEAENKLELTPHDPTAPTIASIIKNGRIIGGGMYKTNKLSTSDIENIQKSKKKNNKTKTTKTTNTTKTTKTTKKITKDDTKMNPYRYKPDIENTKIKGRAGLLGRLDTAYAYIKKKFDTLTGQHKPKSKPKKAKQPKQPKQPKQLINRPTNQYEHFETNSTPPPPKKSKKSKVQPKTVKQLKRVIIDILKVAKQQGFSNVSTNQMIQRLNEVPGYRMADSNNPDAWINIVSTITTKEWNKLNTKT